MPIPRLEIKRQVFIFLVKVTSSEAKNTFQAFSYFTLCSRDTILSWACYALSHVEDVKADQSFLFRNILHELKLSTVLKISIQKYLNGHT